MKMNKEKIKDFILKNCVDSFGFIDLSDLDFSGYVVDLSNIKAESISNVGQKAKNCISNNHQEASTIKNFKQRADFIYNAEQESSEITNSRQEADKIFNCCQISKKKLIANTHQKVVDKNE